MPNAAHELRPPIGALKVQADNAGLPIEGTARLKARAMVEEYAGYLERLVAQSWTLHRSEAHSSATPNHTQLWMNVERSGVCGCCDSIRSVYSLPRAALLVKWSVACLHEEKD